MSWKIVRTFGAPVKEFEEKVMARMDATMEVADGYPGSRDEDTMAEFIGDADAVISVMSPMTRGIMERLPKCRIMTNIGVGYQNFDVEAATDCGILLANNPWYCLEEVSDHAMALLLTLARRIPMLDKAVRAEDTTYQMIGAARLDKTFRLRGQTLGLVGFGRIPQTLVPKAKGFGLRVIVSDPFAPPELFKEAGVESVDLDTLLAESDYVSLHAALNDKTRGMMGVAQFAKMKPTAVLVNTGRGGLVDENALYKALKEGQISSAGLDVTDVEPVPADHPFRELDNVLLTGHSAFYSTIAAVDQWEWPISEIERVLTGHWPKALINTQVKEKYQERFGSMTD